MREYRVLAPISGRYPQVKGRLLTCYSPVRRSSTHKWAFPLDLHVLSTPPAFVLSQDQTLHRKPDPTKNKTSKQSPESSSTVKTNTQTKKIRAYKTNSSTK